MTFTVGNDHSTRPAERGDEDSASDSLAREPHLTSRAGFDGIHSEQIAVQRARVLLTPLLSQCLALSKRSHRLQQ